MQPKTKHNEIVDAINVLGQEGYTELDIARINREIKSLEKAGNFVGAKSAAGMLSALQGDIEATKANFKAAIAASGDQAPVLVNYGKALTNLLHYREAISAYTTALRIVPDQPELLHSALDLHLTAYDLQGATDLIGAMNKLKISIPEEVMDLYEELKGSGYSSGDRWNEFLDRVQLVGDVVLGKGLVWNKVQTFDLDGFSMFELTLPRATIEQLIKAENAIHLAIANSDYLAIDDQLTFGCSTT